MEITEKVAYLKGLMEGMKIDTETNEGKILSAMVDILEDISAWSWRTCGMLRASWNPVWTLSAMIWRISRTSCMTKDDEGVFQRRKYYEDDAEEDEDCYATTCPTCRRPSISMSRAGDGGHHLPPTAAGSWSSTPTLWKRTLTTIRSKSDPIQYGNSSPVNTGGYFSY